MDEKYAAVSFAELSRQMKSLERSAGEFKAKGKAEFEEVSGIELDLPESADRSYASALSEASKVERKLSAQYYDSSMSVPRPPTIGMQLTQKPMGRSKYLQPAPSKPGTGFPLQKTGAGSASFIPSYAPPPDEPSSPQTQAPVTVVIPPHAPGAMPDLGRAVEESSFVQKKEGLFGGIFGAFSGAGKKKQAPFVAPQPSEPSISPKKLEELESMTLPTVLQSEDATVLQKPPISQVPPPPSMPRQRAAPPAIPQSRKMADAQPGQEEKQMQAELESKSQLSEQINAQISPEEQPQGIAAEAEPVSPPPTKIDNISKSLSNIFPQQAQVPLLPPAEESRTFAIKRKFEAQDGREEQELQQLPKKRAKPGKLPPPQKGKKQIPAAKKSEGEEAGLDEPYDEHEAESGLEAIIAKRKKEAVAYGRIQPEEAPPEDLDELIAKRKRASAFAPEPEEAQKPRQEEIEAASDEDGPQTLERVRERMLGKKPTGKAKISSVMDEIERRLAEEEEEERREAVQTPALRRLADVRRRISERQEQAGYVPQKEPPEEEAGAKAVQKEKPKPAAFGTKPADAKEKGKFEVSIKPVFKPDWEGEREEGAEEETSRAPKKSAFAKEDAQPRLSKKPPFAKKEEDEQDEDTAEELPPLRAKKPRPGEEGQDDWQSLPSRKTQKQQLPPKTRMPPKAKEEDMAGGQEEEFSPREARRIAPIASALAKSGGLAPRQRAAQAAGGAPSTARMVGKAPAEPAKSGPYTPSPPKGLAAKFAKRPEEKKQAEPPDEEEAPRRSYAPSSVRRPQVMEPEDLAGEAQQGYAPRSRLRRPLPGGRSQYNTSVPPRMAPARPTTSQGAAQEEQELAPPMPPVPKPSAQQQYPMQKAAYGQAQQPPAAPQQPGQNYAYAQGQAPQPPEQRSPVPQGGQQAAPMPPIPSTGDVKEKAAALGEEALIAYAKDNLKWLYEIYAMGGLTREDFVAKIKEKMNEISAEAQEASGSAPENPALEKLEGMQKKFKK